MGKAYPIKGRCSRKFVVYLQANCPVFITFVFWFLEILVVKLIVVKRKMS